MIGAMLNPQMMQAASQGGMKGLMAQAGPQMGAKNPEGVEREGFLSRVLGRLQQPEFFDRLNMFGAQLQDISDGGMRAAYLREQSQSDEERALAQQQRQELDQLAQSLGMDPRERLMFLSDPESWAAANRSRYEAYTMDRGDRRMIGGEEIASAPDYGISADRIWTTGEDGLPQWGEQRPMSYSEDLEAQALAHRQQMDAERLRLAQAASARAAARAASRSQGGGASGGSSGGLPAGIRWD